MAVNAPHPLYTAMLADWTLMRDVYAGQTAVKDKTQLYLPPTVGMRLDGMETTEQLGYQAYRAYLDRAQFPEFVIEGVRAMVGTMHRKPPLIELPAGMEDMMDAATAEGEGLRQLLRRINEQQLVTGRLGLFADLPEGTTLEKVRPWLSVYNAVSIVNWEESNHLGAGQAPVLVVLDESDWVRQPDFNWKWTTKYRVLRVAKHESVGTDTYEQVLLQTDAKDGANLSVPTDEQYLTPSLAGRTLDKMPFVFINVRDLVGAPDKPPLQGLGNMSLAIYRADADLRQNLHLQGQDTLVILGAPPSTAPGNERTWRTGAGATIELEVGGDAKYIGVDSQGLPEQRMAMEADRQLAANLAGQLIDTKSSQPESGESRRVRIVAQTTTLTEIALTGAAGLQSLLRVVAEWRGLDPNKVKVEPNLDFGEQLLTGDDLVKFMTAKTLGFPISKKSLHALAQDKGITSLDYEEELDEIEKEPENDRPAGTGAGGDPDDDENKGPKDPVDE